MQVEHYRNRREKTVRVNEGITLSWSSQMTNNEILRIAMTQSAIDQNCSADDYLKTENIVVDSRPHPLARKYLKLPLQCDLVSYGNNIVATIDPRYKRLVTDYINGYPAAHCFETPNLHELDDALAPHGLRICFMAEYFLPDVTMLHYLPCAFETRLLFQSDFSMLYLPQWNNALCEKRKELDVIGCGAYDNGKLIGLAGASADCGSMWQIGIDVLPEYRRHGIASALTARLGLEILKRGKVPFYCSAWSNVPSVRNAIRSGFRPAWVEITAKPMDFILQMNSGTNR